MSAPGEGVILFGGSGFLGSAVLEQAPGIVSVGRTAPTTPNRHIHIDSTADLSVLDEERFDTVVFIIGSSAHRMLADERPLPGDPTAYDYHLTPLLETLEQLKGRKLKKFVHFSTVLLYDAQRATLPYAEDAPIDPYRNRHVFAKHLAEESLRFYARWVPSINVRLSNMYGPTTGDGYDLVYQLCRQLVDEGRARMWTNEGERDFIHVEDAARAVLALLGTDFTGTVNLGTGVMTPVTLVREVLQEVSGAEIEVLGKPMSGPPAIQCDVALLKRLTGWEPGWDLADGVRSTYERMLALPLGLTSGALLARVGYVARRVLLDLITIPLFSGAIGYLTNWSGVWMLFNPLSFKGVRVPGLAPFARILPRRLQEIPGVMHGGLGWQGIIPSRAAKMGSIAVDKGIAKVGNASAFYEQLDNDAIAETILASSQGEIRDIVERTMQREHPGLWRDLPPRAREAVHKRVEEQLPDVVREVTDEIGRNIDDLLDVKLMVIRHLEANPELVNRVFLETGRRELKLIVNFGFLFGFILGIPVVFIVHAFAYWWVLPVCGTVVGWVTNWVALWMIFEPTTPKKIGPITLHGLFLRRQPRAAAAYAGVIADDIVTMRNIATELTQGPRADRTRAVIQRALAPTVDRAVGRARGAVRVAMGAREYDAIKDSVATEAYSYAVDPLHDPELNRRQSERLQALITERIQELDSADFSDMLRSAMKEDEWLLLLHGAVLGFGAGLIHLAIFGV